MSRVFAASMQRFSAFWGRLKAKIVKPKHIQTFTFLTVISALVYGIVFSYFTILRNNSFYSAGWDLGNFNQAFHTTLFDGKLFFYTADQFFSPSGSIFAIHTSPILFLLLPIYAISPSPAILLIIKSFAIGLASIPLYFLARELLSSSKGGFVIALVYLLYPPLHGANWFDFQQSAFFALFLFLTYFFLTKKNWKLYFPMMMLTLIIEEHVSIVIAILAVYYFSYNSSLRALPKSLKQFKMNESWASILTIVVCIAYLFTAMSIKNTFPVNPDFAHIYEASGNFRILGSSNTFTLPAYAVLNPQRALDALTYDFAYKFFYMIFLFSPLLFMPLRNRFCLGIAFILLPFILSNYRAYYLIGIHYPFYVIPLIFIAAIYGIRRLELGSRIFNFRTMVVVTLLFAICTSPLSPISRVFVDQGTASYTPIEFTLDENRKSIDELVKLIPPDASVLTQNLIFPHVSDRLNAYLIPFSDYERPTEMKEYINRLLDDSEYVLLDMGSIDDMATMVLNQMTKNNAYAPYALGKQAIMFKRGFHDEPINAYYVNQRTFKAYRDILFQAPPGSIIEDSSSNSGKVLIYPKTVSGYSIYGPYIYLLQGVYDITYTVKVGDHEAGFLGTFDIVTDGGTRILSFRDMYDFELRTDEWINVTLPFSLSRLTTGMEFRFFSNGNAEVFFDTVTLRRTSTVATENRSMTMLRTRDLQLSSGTVNEEGFLHHQRGSLNEVFWFGPYWKFNPGNYTATFLVRMTSTAQEQRSEVLTLSISGKIGEASLPIIINERTLYTEDFTANIGTSDWHSFKVDFTIEKPMIDVELRGLFPTPDSDLSLAFIILERLDPQ